MAEIKKHSSLGITLDVGSVKAVSGLTDIPDMGATPEKLEVTTLSDECRTYINGIKDFGDLEFTFIYESGTDGNYAKLAAIESAGEDVELKVTFPDGASFTFSGKVNLRILGVGVNAVITFAMSVALSSDIVYSA